MSSLEVHELYRFYHRGDDEIAALRGVSITVRPREIVAIVGPSGSGKSTLLSCVTGLDKPDGGYVVVAGTRLTRCSEAERARLRARFFGIMMQGPNMFPHLTIYQNLLFHMQLLGRPDGARLDYLLATVGLSHRVRAFPTELSGGETARASLALALATDPPILVADEPTAEVDQESESRLIELFVAQRATACATLIATHSEPLARKADRVLRLRDGRIVDD